jgi:hypothetical protein
VWGALSDKRMDLSFLYAAGPCQRSLSRVRVSDLTLPFSLPPTTRRVTVEVFDPASTRVAVFYTLSVGRLRDGTTEELLGDVFSVRSVPSQYNEEQLRLRDSLETAVRRVGVNCETVAGQ